MNHHFDIVWALQLQSIARAWRNHWSTILTLAILVEVAIDTFWRDHPRIFTPTWREHFLERKTIAIFLVGFAIVISLNRENSHGQDADDRADEIQGYQQEQIADAENRSARAVEQNTRLRRALGPPMLYVDRNSARDFFKLTTFGRISFMVEGQPDQSNMGGVFSFLELRTIGWDWVKPPLSWAGTPKPNGILIMSRRPEPWTPELLDSPYKMSLKTQEARAWAAGEALMLYLQSTGVPNVDHMSLSTDPNGNIDPHEPAFCRLPLPRDGLFIMVGDKPPEDSALGRLDIDETLREADEEAAEAANGR